MNGSSACSKTHRAAYGSRARRSGVCEPAPGGRSFALLHRYAEAEDPDLSRIALGAIMPVFPGSPVIYMHSGIPEGRFGGVLFRPDPADAVERIGRTATIRSEGRFDIKTFEAYDPRHHLAADEIARIDRALGKAEIVRPTASRPLFPTRAEQGYLDLAPSAADLLGRQDYREALRLVEQGRRSGALSAAEAHFLNALIYMDQNEPGARQSAEAAIRRAIALDRGNLRYRLVLAQILHKRTFPVYADINLDRLLTEDIGIPDGLALRGVIRLEVLWAHGWHGGGWGSPGVYARKMPVEAAIAEALNYLHQALLLDPDNDLAVWWLALHHLLDEDWPEVLRISEMMLEQSVLEGEAWLARGLALQHLEHLEQAHEAYRAGIQILGEQYGEAASSPRWVVPATDGGVETKTTMGMLLAPGATDPVGTAVGGEIETFWRGRNPLFSSSVNERLLEQYRRLAYVTWVFSNVVTGQRGWETVRGAVYMRYGEPSRMVRDELTYLRRRIAGGLMRVGWRDPDQSVEEWFYPGFSIGFGGALISGDLAIWGDRGTINTRADYLKKIEEVPDLDRVIGFGGVRDLVARWYLFDGGPGRWVLVPAFQVPAELRLLSRGLAAAGQEEGSPVHFFALGADWRPLVQGGFELPTDRPGHLEERGDYAGPVLEVMDRVGEPLPRYGRIEVVPAFARYAWTSTDTLELDRPPGAPFLSSIVLATDVQEWVTGQPVPEGAFVRSGMVIHPRPGGNFGSRERLYLYFEVSGLERDEVGLSICRIDLELASPEGGSPTGGIIRRTLGRLLQRQSPEGRILTSIERETIGGRLEQWIELESSDWSPGVHVLRIRVHDEVGGAGFEREQTIHILPPITTSS